MAHDVGSLLRSTPTSPCTSSFFFVFSKQASERDAFYVALHDTSSVGPGVRDYITLPALLGNARQAAPCLLRKTAASPTGVAQLKDVRQACIPHRGGRQCAAGYEIPPPNLVPVELPLLRHHYHIPFHAPARAAGARRAPPPARPRAAPRAFPSQSARSSFPQNTPLYKIITEPTGLSAAITRVSAAPVRRRGSLAHPILPDRHEHLEDIPHTAHCKPLAMGFMRFAPFSGHRWPKHGHTRKRCCASAPAPGAKSVLPACHGLALKYKSHCLSLRLSLPSHTLCANLSRLRMGIKSDIYQREPCSS